MSRIGRGLSLFIGGARSGKSDVVVQLGEAWPGEVVFVATATAGDDDMGERIRRHQLDRPSEWGLVESPTFGAADLDAIEDEALVIVDCVTLLVSNLFFADVAGDQVVAHVGALADVGHGGAQHLGGLGQLSRGAQGHRLDPMLLRRRSGKSFSRNTA